MCEERRPNTKAVIENLKKPMPLGEKFFKTIRNTLLKIIRMKTCCGNKGEPGC
ncbi:MAG TPA: hypothetical protein VK435_08335 [Thermodesulfovibrionales bacterium]|nr:hypothetical protein [Thermodesulfovibrionales bacterium]